MKKSRGGEDFSMLDSYLLYKKSGASILKLYAMVLQKHFIDAIIDA